MCTALVVANSVIFRRALKDVLHRRFASMYVAEICSGDKALEIVDSLLPDIIIFDLVSSEESGLKVISRLKTQLPNSVIVVLIDPDVPECRSAALASGASHVLSKGTSSAVDIVAVIDRALPDR
jgi:DNA-binding NarL/FixJ family response regulator